MKTISETTAKRHVSKLQLAVVDGLEDVKAQNIQVFDTTTLSPLFERVVVASATSSRQTKALAASVRDKVKEAGFDKPRVEGEENGEWVVVDCGAIVVHIMQPAIREYYRLEEIWGDKPVRAAFKTARINADKAAKAARAQEENAQPAAAKKAPAKRATARKAPADTAAQPAARKAASKSSAAKPVAKTAASKSPASKTTATKTAASKKPATKVGASKTAAAKTAATKTAVKKTAVKSVAKTAVKKVSVNAPQVKKPKSPKPASKN